MTRSHPSRTEVAPSMGRRDFFKFGGAVGALLLVGCGAKKPVAAVPENVSTPAAEETQQTIDLTDISPENLWKMTPEQRLDAIRIPESALEDPEGYVKTYNKYLEAIYNAGSSDDEYKQYIDQGGTNYAAYVYEKYYEPMLEQLQGHSPSDSLEGEGALTIAYRMGRIQYMRLENGMSSQIAPYHYTIRVGELTDVSSDKQPMDITYTYLMGDTIDTATREAMGQIWGDPGESFNIIDDTPVVCTMIGVQYRPHLKSVTPRDYIYR